MKKILVMTVSIILIVNLFIDTSLRLYIKFHVQEQHIIEISKLIEEEGGLVHEIEVWSEVRKRSFWYKKLTSFRLYKIYFSKDSKQEYAIYGYPEGYLLDLMTGKHVSGRWYLTPE